MKKLKEEYLKWKTSEGSGRKFNYALHTGDWEFMKTDKYEDNRLEYAEHTNMFEEVIPKKKLKAKYLKWKTSEGSGKRFNYAIHTGDWKFMKTDEYYWNRRRYAEHTGDWGFLKTDKDEGNRKIYEEHANMFE